MTRPEKISSLWLVVYLLLICLPAVSGVVDTEEFSSETLRLRYLDLTQELRCPKCQNQNLADSNSEISIDLRNEIRRMLEEGKSDSEITEFLVARYGDFVLYRPPVKSTTWMLWGGPAVLVLLGLVAILVVRRKNRPKADLGSGLSKEEQQKLDELLQASVNSNNDETKE